MTEINEGMRPLSRERAQYILATGHDGFGTGCGRKEYSELLTDTELQQVQHYFAHVAPGNWSFNDIIRKCAK